MYAGGDAGRNRGDLPSSVGCAPMARLRRFSGTHRRAVKPECVEVPACRHEGLATVIGVDPDNGARAECIQIHDIQVILRGGTFTKIERETEQPIRPKRKRR